ncbi:MAG TPA: M13 family metallopeptidase, partial [Candidatus Aquilonibacter sp.]|nr:M13 family metallopeptidase [Candidatus Aquilonibacter sp.]
SLAPVLAQLQLANVNVFFGFGSGADFKNSTMDISQLAQAGLGLPDRDYYLKTDAASKKLQDAYVAHVAQMFTLLGESQAQAQQDAATVMMMETTLAKSQMSRVEERDPQKVYNKTDLAGLQKMAPEIDWASYFSASGVTPEAINVAQPEYFKALSSDLASWTPAQIKTYLRWHTVHAFASALPKAFDDANFAFYGQTLRGAKEQLVRWKRCTGSTDANLGEALGQLYVAKAFPQSAKAQALEMVHYVKSALHTDMGQLSWMTPATKARAQAKLDAFLLKIGYPDKWRSYAGLDVTPGPYATNVIQAYIFNNKWDYAHINKPVDRTLWGMTPPTVNAYYDPTVNEIVFPAGILQPPFFDATGDMAMNFGGIGAVIGHESTHGFDDEGSQFDAKGNLANWWSPADKARFNAREQCIIDQYNALSPAPGVKENGKLVVGEATADLGGLTIAYKAFEEWQAKHPRVNIDGYTPEQRFFLGWAHVWASNQREQTIALYAKTDVHAYDKFRVNATLSNMPQFAAAWGCKAGTPMVRPANKRCQIW